MDLCQILKALLWFLLFSVIELRAQQCIMLLRYISVFMDVVLNKDWHNRPYRSDYNFSPNDPNWIRILELTFLHEAFFFSSDQPFIPDICVHVKLLLQSLISNVRLQSGGFIWLLCCLYHTEIYCNTFSEPVGAAWMKFSYTIIQTHPFTKF